MTSVFILATTAFEADRHILFLDHLKWIRYLEIHSHRDLDARYYFLPMTRART